MLLCTVQAIAEIVSTLYLLVFAVSNLLRPRRLVELEFKDIYFYPQGLQEALWRKGATSIVECKAHKKRTHEPGHSSNIAVTSIK